jgi:hypothetical protein
MAINYYFDIATAKSPAATLGALATQDGFVWRGDHLVAPDIVMAYAKATNPVGQGLIEGQLGFVPTVGVVFNVDKDGDSNAARERIILASLALAESEDANAVLVFGGNGAIFARVGGRLTLSSHWSWPETMLAKISAPHTIGELPEL